MRGRTHGKSLLNTLPDGFGSLQILPRYHTQQKRIPISAYPRPAPESQGIDKSLPFCCCQRQKSTGLPLRITCTAMNIHLVPQVCPGCCLRHAGVRGDVYASTAPLASELLSTVSDAAAASQSAAPAQEDTVSGKAALNAPGVDEPLPKASDAAQSTACIRQSEHESAPASSGAAHAAAAACSAGTAASPEQNGHPMPESKSKAAEYRSSDPFCTVCLGVLQCLDRLSLTAPAENITAAVQQWDCASGREWQPLASCAPKDIAAQVK